MAGFSLGSFTPINVIFQATASAQTGFAISQHGIGAMRNLGLVATGAQPANYGYSGFQISGPVTFNRIGVVGFSNNSSTTTGFALSGSASSVMLNCASTNNGTGMQAVNASIICLSCVFTHNLVLGIWLNTANAYSMQGVCICAGNSFGSKGQGILVSQNSVLCSQGSYLNGAYSTGNWWLTLNAYDGVFVWSISQYTQSSGNDALYSNHNGLLAASNDVNVRLLSLVSQVSITGSRSFNIAVGTLSSDGSLIY